LRLSTAYGMVIDTLAWLEQTVHIQVIVVDIDYPLLSSNRIYNAVRDKFEMYSHGDVKLAIFSHISSMPSMVEPVKDLTELAHAHGSIVLIGKE
jgi:selenocysteine lyase/cysteine desulfurase